MRPLSRALEALGSVGENIETLGGRVGTPVGGGAEPLVVGAVVEDIFLLWRFVFGRGREVQLKVGSNEMSMGVSLRGK